MLRSFLFLLNKCYKKLKDGRNTNLSWFSLLRFIWLITLLSSNKPFSSQTESKISVPKTQCPSLYLLFFDQIVNKFLKWL